MADVESSDNVGSQNGKLNTPIARSGDEQPNNVADSYKNAELPVL
jgi:hypothetical protein